MKRDETGREIFKGRHLSGLWRYPAYSVAAREPKLRGISLDEACRLSLSELVKWVAGVPESLPEEMRPMANSISESFQTVAKRLMDLGLAISAWIGRPLRSPPESGSECSSPGRCATVQPAFYMCWTSFYWPAPFQYCRVDRSDARLIADGNSVVLVDHDTQILSEADWIVEMGPQAGADGGYVIAQGTVPEIIQSAASQIGLFYREKPRLQRKKAK